MEGGKELVGLVKDVPQVLSMFYKDLAQPGVQKLGNALGTVLEFSTSFLLPVKLLNEKFKLNFEKRLNEYKEKLEQIPEDDICEVNPQVGTPIVDKLSYTTNEEIADLFTSILARASSKKTVNFAHPAFIQMIERLSVDEARIIKHLSQENYLPCFSFNMHLKNNGGYLKLITNATGLEEIVEFLFPSNIDVYIQNLLSLGVLDLNPKEPLLNVHDDFYDKMFKRVDKLESKYNNENDVERFEKLKGLIFVTEFGRTFIKACNFELKVNS
ncbi:MAG: DUF4393 domain-containing protein [Leeuwenhoekiella sp.]